jgi:hypothetical protein
MEVAKTSALPQEKVAPNAAGKSAQSTWRTTPPGPSLLSLKNFLIHGGVQLDHC